MIHFKSKIDAVVLSELKSLVTREREVTAEILHYLREVEARKLHLERGFPSLFEFAVKELGYSAGSAHRRIASMRLLKSVPSLETKIQSGELSLTVAAQAQSFFREESKRRKVTSDEKRETVESLLGLSARECERKLLALSPEAALPKERARVVTDDLTQIQFLADRELLAKLEKLKGLLAHRNFEGSYAVLFNQLADLALKKLVPTQNESPQQNQSPGHGRVLDEQAMDRASPRKVLPEVRIQGSESKAPNHPTAAKETRYLPKILKAEVYERDGGKCTYHDRKTNHRCSSTHALEYDHRTPLCMGGETSADNLRLLCSAHHRLETEKLAMIV